VSTVTYTIRKTPHEREWAARFHQDGVFMPTWTVFETDRPAAEASAQATVAWAAARDKAALPQP